MEQFPVGGEGFRVLGKIALCLNAQEISMGGLCDVVYSNEPRAFSGSSLKVPAALPDERVSGLPGGGQRERELGKRLASLAVDHGTFDDGRRGENDLVIEIGCKTASPFLVVNPLAETSLWTPLPGDSFHSNRPSSSVINCCRPRHAKRRARGTFRAIPEGQDSGSTSDRLS